MSSYTLTIGSTDKARQTAIAKGYNFVFAKGVSSGGDVDYNAAWIVLDPKEMTDSDVVSWDVDYKASFSTQEFKNKAKIVGKSNPIKMAPGGEYVVSSSGTLEIDPNRSPQGSAFHFHNDQGYTIEYVPILESLDDNGNSVPIWAASTGVSINGLISATPIEVVRVWLGKYEQGQAVLAEYSTIGVEFDLTTLRNGTATINDTLSDWTSLSPNAKTFVPNSNFILPFPDDATNNYLKSIESDVDPITVTVLATFTTALTVAAATYLLNKLINKFSGGLKPSSIEVSAPGGVKLTVKFQKTGVVLSTLGLDAYENAVNSALTLAQQDSTSGLQGEKWSLSEPSLTVSYS